MHQARAAQAMAFGLLIPFLAHGQDENLDAFEKELEARWEQLGAYSAEMQMHLDITRSGVRMTSDMKGPLLFQRIEEGRARQRSELSGTVGGGPWNLLQVDTRVLTVSDGVSTYTESHVRNTVKVTKTRALRKAEKEASTPGGGAEKLKKLKAQYDLKRLPDKMLGERAAYVIEGRPRAGSRQELPEAERMLLYFDRETAILVIMALLNAQGQPLMELKFNHIVLNPPIEETQFQYSPPPGVEVIDKTEETSPASSP